METRPTAFGLLTLRPDGILHAVFDFEGKPTEEAVAEYLLTREEMIGDGSVPSIVEIVKIPYVDRSIRQFLMDEMRPPPCRAVVTTDHALLTMFRTYQMVDGARTPTEVFATVEAAVDWIKSQGF